jgi:hypothetical protein
MTNIQSRFVKELCIFLFSANMYLRMSATPESEISQEQIFIPIVYHYQRIYNTSLVAIHHSHRNINRRCLSETHCPGNILATLYCLVQNPWGSVHCSFEKEAKYLSRIFGSKH